MKRLNGNVLMSVDGHSGVETVEGKAAYTEAINFLKTQKPVAALRWASELAIAAQDHVNDIGPKGIMSSIGSDGSMPQDRLARYCLIDEAWAESLCFGATTPEDVLERMLVDDGQASRGHRKNIFSREMKVIGIATAPHMETGNVVLFEYAKSILREGELPTIHITVAEEIPPELLAKMKEMGIDTNKLKVKTDHKDAKVKAQNLFKKATNVIGFAGKLSKDKPSAQAAAKKA
jgi:hypothetical protein